MTAPIQSRPFRLLVILSHPVQYFSPLFAELASRPALDVEIWYGHPGAVDGMRDEQFGTEISWGTALLDGYQHRFFRNASWRPRLGTHFWGVFNPGMSVAFARYRPDAVLIPGWAYASYPLVWLFATLLRIPIWIRADNPLSQEKRKSGTQQALKRWFLRHLAFPSVTCFLAVGKQNADWYRDLGVPEPRIIRAPHAVDTVHFDLLHDEREAGRRAIRRKFGIPENACLFLFVGKLIDKKYPMDVLDAAVALPDCHLLFVGEGALSSTLRDASQQQASARIHFAGFVDQLALPAHYAAADVLILPSGMGETWGLVVNEAIAAGLTVLVSDLCGCAPDLARDGINGFQFPCRDVNALRERMQWCLQHKDKLRTFGAASRHISEEFTLSAAADGFEQAARFTALPPSHRVGQ